MASSRKERINGLYHLIKAEKKGIKRSKAVSLFSFNTGVSKRMTEEYLNILIEVGKVKQDRMWILTA